MTKIGKRNELGPPECDPESAVDESLLEDEEDDEDKEHESGEYDNTIEPVSLFESSNELLGGEHE